MQDQIGIEKLRASKDGHLNDIVSHSNGGAGGWIWDSSPCDIGLMREAGECSKGYLPSQCAHTCVGKAAARIILERDATITLAI